MIKRFKGLLGPKESPVAESYVKGNLEFLVLDFLSGDPMSVRDIIAKIRSDFGVLIPASTTYLLLRELKGRGWLRFESKRGKELLYALTPKGERALTDWFECQRRLCDLLPSLSQGASAPASRYSLIASARGAFCGSFSHFDTTGSCFIHQTRSLSQVRLSACLPALSALQTHGRLRGS